MEKRKFRIGELANHLNVERFVIRFWEKEFNIKSHRSNGRQRFYSEDDLEKFKAVKELLYEKRFTIAGAKQMLKTGHISGREKHDILASHITTMESSATKTSITEQSIQKKLSKDFIKKLQSLRATLVTFKKHI